MATKLTKKQQTQLTEKLTGIIRDSNALQLRLSMDRSVNEMNVTQISGELNRIHYRAIGKDLPTEISIPVKQLGSGDPSPENIRPFVGYEIDGIGTVYGGELNIETGVLNVTKAICTLTGSETWLVWGQAYYSTSLPISGINDIQTINAYGSKLKGVSAESLYTGSNSSGVAVRAYKVYISIADFDNIALLTGMQILYDRQSPSEITLTPQQMLQLLDQL